jgi:LysR family nitrogen assimilation transcriptional regulator
MDIRSLRYFVTAATLNSISKAANYLHVAQPALSRRIRKLERDLDTELFSRDSRGVQLTEAGARLLEKGESILRQIDQMAAEVRASGKDPAGQVSVALMPSVAALIAPLLVTRMRERHPAVSLRISEGLTTSIVGGLLSHKFDLGLIPAQPVETALVSEPLLTEPMFLIGPNERGATKNAKSPITMKQLANYPLLLPSRGNVLREQIESLAKRNSVALNIKEDIDSTAVIKHLMLSGLGFTIQCYSFVHEEVESGRLHVRALRIPGLSRQWALARLRGHPQSLASITTTNIMLEIAGDISKRKGWKGPYHAQ